MRLAHRCDETSPILLVQETAGADLMGDSGMPVERRTFGRNEHAGFGLNAFSAEIGKSDRNLL